MIYPSSSLSSLCMIHPIPHVVTVWYTHAVLCVASVWYTPFPMWLLYDKPSSLFDTPHSQCGCCMLPWDYSMIQPILCVATVWQTLLSMGLLPGAVLTSWRYLLYSSCRSFASFSLISSTGRPSCDINPIRFSDRPFSCLLKRSVSCF